VSLPRKSGPSMFFPFAYSQMAWVVARMWASLKVPERRAAVAAGAERDQLAGIVHVGVRP